MFDEFWVVLELSFDLLLQAIDLFTYGLYGWVVCKLRFVGGENDVCLQRPFRIPDRGQRLRHGVEVDS